MISLSEFCNQAQRNSKIMECKVSSKEINENRKQLGLMLASDIKEYCKKFGNQLDLIHQGVSLDITFKGKTPQGAKTIHLACFEFEKGRVYAIDNDKNHTKFDLGTAEEIINSNYDLGLVILRELDKLLSTVITD